MVAYRNFVSDIGTTSTLNAFSFDKVDNDSVHRHFEQVFALEQDSATTGTLNVFNFDKVDNSP